MRKTLILISILLMASMVLAACGTQETETTVPGTKAPAFCRTYHRMRVPTEPQS